MKAATLSSARFYRLIASAAFVLLAALRVGAQDVLTIGSGSAAAGGTVTLPVYLRDVSGTPLGMDALRIQALSLRVNATPDRAANLSFARAGAIESLTPAFEHLARGREGFVTSSGYVGYLATFRETTEPLPLVLNAPAPGTRIGTLTVTLAQITAGTEVTIAFDRGATALSNQAGTTTETVFNHHLQLVNGTVTVTGATTSTALTVSPNPSTSPERVSMTATVQAADGTPVTGSVTFSVDGKPFGFAEVTNGSATLATTSLPAGTHSITAHYDGSTRCRPSDSNVVTHLVNRPPFGTPANVTAKALNSSSVKLDWVGVSGATQYEIYRRSTHGAFGAYYTTVTGAYNTFTDTAVSPNTTYFYALVAVDASNGARSAMSAVDHATTVAYSEPYFWSGITIRLDHLTQLRVAVNAFRAAAGLPPAVFTDPSPTRQTMIKRVHVNELRAAIQSARAAMAMAALNFSDGEIGERSTVKWVHFQELRDAAN